MRDLKFPCLTIVLPCIACASHGLSTRKQLERAAAQFALTLAAFIMLHPHSHVLQIRLQIIAHKAQHQHIHQGPAADILTCSRIAHTWLSSTRCCTNAILATESAAHRAAAAVMHHTFKPTYTASLIHCVLFVDVLSCSCCGVCIMQAPADKKSSAATILLSYIAYFFQDSYVHTVALEAGQALAVATASLPQGQICFARCFSEKPSGEHSTSLDLCNDCGVFIDSLPIPDSDVHTVALDAGQALAVATASQSIGQVCFAHWLSEKQPGDVTMHKLVLHLSFLGFLVFCVLMLMTVMHLTATASQPHITKQALTTGDAAGRCLPHGASNLQANQHLMS